MVFPDNMILQINLVRNYLFSQLKQNFLIFRYEDLRALDGGKDGLQTIENILMLSSVVLKAESLIFLEIDPCHKFLLPALLKEINEKILENGNKLVLESISKDFLEKDRFAIIRKCSVQK